MREAMKKAEQDRKKKLPKEIRKNKGLTSELEDILSRTLENKVGQES